MVQTAHDGRPDVEIKASIKIPREDILVNTTFVRAAVAFTVDCRFCEEAEQTNDLLKALRQAEAHVNSRDHIENKAEYQNVDVAPPMDLDQMARELNEHGPYPPTDPRGQHGLNQVQPGIEPLWH